MMAVAIEKERQGEVLVAEQVVELTKQAKIKMN